MARTSTRLAATGLALGAALSLLGMTGSAHAVAQVSATVQAGSNLRAEPDTNSRVRGTTTSQAQMHHIKCFKYSQYVQVGNYGTNVWYYGHVDDRGTTPTTWYYDAWVWGGNVNVGADPASGVPQC